MVNCEPHRRVAGWVAACREKVDARHVPRRQKSRNGLDLAETERNLRTRLPSDGHPSGIFATWMDG